MRFVAQIILASCLISFANAEPARIGNLDRILSAHTLRVCIWPDYFSITYRNPKTQQLSGIDIDLAKAFSKDIGDGIAVEFIDSSFAYFIDDLLGKRCDIAMFAVGVTPSRSEKLRFSKPYLRSDIYAITTRANRRIHEWADIDQPGVVVAVAKGTLHEPVMRENLRHATLAVMDTPFAREKEVESGRADVFMTDYPYSQRMLQNADWARLITPSRVYHMTSYAYAIAPGDEVWLARIDRFVADIKRDGRLMSTARKYRLEPIVVTD
jgi:ABC-type amino acid transport substrate-binding protein